MPRSRSRPRAALRGRKASSKAAPHAAEPGQIIPLEVDSSSVETSLARLRSELSHWVNKGRFTRVRFKFRGKPILPDVPLAAVVAAEAATFWWAGLLRALVVNFGARTVFDVELVNDADSEVARGKERLLAGELDLALAHFEKAVAMNRDCAGGHLNIGVAHKLKGSPTAARDAFERARAIDPKGPIGAEADRQLVALDGGAGRPP